MSRQFNHVSIGLSEVSSSLAEGNSEIPRLPTISGDKNGNKDLNLKATDLRFGIPGSESPEREEIYSVGVLKNLGFSGVKRGFFDTTDTSKSGCGTWVLGGGSGSGGSDAVDLSKKGSSSSNNSGGLFSPRGVDSAPKPLIGLDPAGPETGLGSPVISRKDGVSPILEKKAQNSASAGNGATLASKSQVVGWPPIRSFRKNTMATNLPKMDHENKSDAGFCLYVKVSMDGAPYLRKVDLKTYGSYAELSSSLEKMFSCFTIGKYGYNGVPSRDGSSGSRLTDLLRGSEYVLTYEDRDNDWMLVGDVPWDMFINSCKRLRITKSSDAIGLASTKRQEPWKKCRSLD